MQTELIWIRRTAWALGLAGALMSTGCGLNESPQSLIAAGKDDAAKKDHKAAVIRFKSALQMDPLSAEARYLLGRSLLGSGDPGGAVVALTQALEQKYATDLVLPPLARALLLTGAYKKLVMEFGSVDLMDKAAQADFKTNVASAWAALGDRVKTAAAIEAALQASPGYGPALLLNVRVLAGKGDSVAALALVDKILAADASLADAWHLKGEVLAHFNKDMGGSETAYRKALSLKPDYVPAHISLISSRMLAGDLDGARAQADKLRALLPKHPQTLFVDAQIAFAAKDMVKAREIIQQMMRAYPNHVGVLQMAGALEGRSGSLMSAERLFVKALQINPGLAGARRNLAQVYLRLGQPTRALEVLQPLLAADGAYADAQAAAGEAYLRLGDAAAAEAHFSRAAKIDPSDNRVKTAIALTYLERGDAGAAFAELEALSARSKDTFADSALVSARIKRREFDAALKAVDTMAKKEPNSAVVAELRGRIHLERRDYAAARAALDVALKIDPKFFAATAALAAIDVIEKKPAQAQKRFEEAIQVDPRNFWASMGLADVLTRADSPFETIKTVLTQAIKNSPSEAGPRLQLIHVMLKKRLYKDALAVAQEAAAALPNDESVLDALGRTQMEAGEVEQAMSTFRRIAGANPTSPLPYSRLADLYKASGNRAAAEASLRKALEIDPKLAIAQVALVELLLNGKRHPEALEFARGMQKSRPLDPAGYLIEAQVHTRLKGTDAAMAAFRKGLAVPSAPLELAREYYMAMLKAERAADADRFAAAWIKQHPEDTAFDYQMAVTAITRGDLDQAEARLRRVVSKRPNHPLALNNLAWTLSYRKKPGGIEYAQRAIDLMPDKPALMDTLAMALAVDKQLDKALSTQKRAVELEPTNKGLRLNLAKIALQAGDKTLARTELEALKAVGPSLPYYKQVTELLLSL